ncbi:MAG: YhbY family RNA-binding protein [Phycisphaerae bacterium]|nr:YhbY family RNA-binding protein [Phycisphaerae bacterium]
MAISGKLRRELTARSHHLKTMLTVAHDGITDQIVAHVRQSLARHDLIKVRVSATTAAESDAAAAQLAERVPCELVRRVGRVVLLYSPPEDASIPCE